MAREIKFRAWDKENNRMLNSITPADIGNKDGEWIFDEDWAEGIVSDWIQNYELMQFTGLLDKNRKEIYEGDIVNWGDNFPSEVIWDTKVVSETPGFWLKEKGDYKRPTPKEIK